MLIQQKPADLDRSQYILSCRGLAERRNCATLWNNQHQSGTIAVEIKTVGGARPGAGRPFGSQSPRNRMIAAYCAALGTNVTEIVRRNVERVVDLELLAAAARAAALRGEESIGNVTRLEIQASKAVRMLNLPEPGAAVAPVQTVADYWAARGAAPEEAEE
jgi:hypothetical protein